MNRKQKCVDIWILLFNIKSEFQEYFYYSNEGYLYKKVENMILSKRRKRDFDIYYKVFELFVKTWSLFCEDEIVHGTMNQGRYIC